MIKRIHLYVVKSYLGPFVLTFTIALFVLLMQFLWKYLEDLVGKGLEWYIIAELLVYASASLVPLALPLAILLASIMTFGNLAERYELIAMKSVGLSLPNIMKWLIVVTVLTSLGAFYFSNNILPVANLKFGALLYDITQQKPGIDLKEGIFYNGIEGFSIRVKKKEKGGEILKDIMIYDHTNKSGNTKVILAEKGKMTVTPDKQFMILELENGYSYDDYKADHRSNEMPLLRSKFKKQIVRFDLSQFKLSRTDEGMFKDHYGMLNLSQLKTAVVDLYVEQIKSKENIQKIIKGNSNYQRYFSDTLYQQSYTLRPQFDTLIHFENFSKNEKLMIVEGALNAARTAKLYVENLENDLDNRIKFINRHNIEWHRKLTLSVACIVLFFIGAPLGAIIRKGGLGMPVVVSVIFFLIFHIISITGEKSAREGVISAFWGMWMATFILLPLGIFLTYKASRDSSLFDIQYYLDFFKKFKKTKNT
ncbi:MAG: LptF/LptG family permease [Bacteroidia bacterium]